MIPTRHYLWAELLSLSHDTSNSTHAFRISQLFFVLFGVEHLSSENLPLSFPSQSINFALTILQAANQPTQHVAKLWLSEQNSSLQIHDPRMEKVVNSSAEEYA